MDSKIRDIDIVDEPHYVGAELYNDKVSEAEESYEKETALGLLRSEIPSTKHQENKE